MNEPLPSSTNVSARQCAAILLGEVLDHKRPFDEAASRQPLLAALSDRDRNFCRLLVLTCLRRLGQIDALLALFLTKPLTGRTSDVRHCLRLGVVQLLWLQTPPHAAVHAMVETVKAMNHASMQGVVNAVLKRVAAEGAAIVAAQDEAGLSLPGWLYDSWRKAYGEDVARAIALARLQEPPLDLTVKNDAAGWAEKLGGVVLPNGSVRLAQGGRVDTLPGYAAGEWWVQDAAAALPAQLLGDVRGQTVLDLCAAPGGKTAQLAAAGAKVIAVDQSKRRLERLSANLQRLQLAAETVESDILRWKPPAPVDAVLLDAPCSATGTCRRHPEVVWSRTPEDVAGLVVLQQRMLRRSAGWLKPGGRLVYCVCSLQPEEGERPIERFLAEHPAFTLAAAAPALPEFASGAGALRTHPALWPEQGGLDGFYAACLRLNNN